MAGSSGRYSSDAFAQFEKTLSCDMYEYAFATGREHTIGADFTRHDIAPAPDFLDPADQFEIGVERRWKVKTHIDGARDTGLSGHDLRDAEKVIEQRADKSAMHRTGRAFIRPAQIGMSMPRFAVDPNHERGGDRIAFAIHGAEFIAEAAPCAVTTAALIGVLESLAPHESRGLIERFCLLANGGGRRTQTGCVAGGRHQGGRQLTDGFGQFPLGGPFVIQRGLDVGR